MHRLDANTTGLMVVAKSERAYSVLKQAFRDREVDKSYHALVQGHPDPLRGTIDAPIGRHPRGDGRFAVVAGGRPSVTHYDTLEAFRAASLVEVSLETGRTHQIRVHMSALRHPCCGDLIYGADPVARRPARPDPAVAARRPAGLRAPGPGPRGHLRQRLRRRPAARPRRPARRELAAPSRSLQVSWPAALRRFPELSGSGLSTSENAGCLALGGLIGICHQIDLMAWQVEACRLGRHSAVACSISPMMCLASLEESRK